jgi:type II restriction enzyme
MDLHLPRTGVDAYKSASQRARVATELWGEANLYCASCTAPRLSRLQHNTAAIDYRCTECKSTFQLKSQSKRFGRKIVDSAYSKMKSEILEDRTPNLYVLRYDLLEWKVRTVILIPRFAFTISAVERRPPLAATARRAGWVGCNILLDRIAMDARILIVEEGRILSNEGVRRAYDRLRPVEQLDVEKRGWTLDVLQVVSSLNRTEFSLSDVYAHADALARLHPKNFHVRDKIRQQLQVLRNLGLVSFLGSGIYRLR